MKTFRKLVGVLLLILAASVAVWMNHPVRVIVRNVSGLEIADVSVVLGPHRIEIDGLEPGERKEKWLFYRGSDASIHIEGTPSGERKIELRWGYITHSPDFETFLFEFQSDQTIQGTRNP